MFNKENLDELFADLRGRYGNDPDWETILRQTHLGVAYSDAGVALEDKDIDARVVQAIERFKA